MNVKDLNAQMRAAYHAAGIKGQGITFAVFDTGVEPVGALRGRVTGDAGDEKNHGTWVAENILRYCPEATILSYKITYPRDVVTACEDVVRRAKQGQRLVVNMSMGTGAEDIRDAVDAVVAAGVPFVCAAGNDGGEVLDEYPSCFESPITVAALDENGNRAYFSTWHDEVDFADHGRNVEGIGNDGKKMVASGTSMACPQVAGKVGLLMCARPDLTEPQIYEALKNLAQDLRSEGRDPYTGYGFIDLGDPQPAEKDNEGEEIDMARNLKLTARPRMQGDDVKELQKLLTAHGIKCDDDGIFGPATDTAVRKFQQAKGLDDDGIVGPATWAALRKVPTANAPSTGKDAETVVEQLTELLRLMVGDHYIYGAQGHKLTRSYLASRAAAVPKYFKGGRREWLEDEIKRAEALGRTLYCEDCSGLFFKANEVLNIIPKKDATAQGLWGGYCKPISKDEVRPGDILFRRDADGDMGHMAVVGTDGVYEAIGTEYGVVFRPWADRFSRKVYNRMTGEVDTLSNWTHYGRLKVLT